MVCHDHRSDRQTDSSETAPPVARRRRGGAAVAGPVWHKSRRPWIQGLCLGGAGRTHRRSGYRRVVGVPQPGGLVRALGRHRADDRHPGRGMEPQTRVDGAILALRLRHPDPVPRLRRLGRGQPSPRRRTSARDDGRDRRARVRSVDARADRGHQRRPRCDVRVALDQEPRGEAHGPSRRPASGATAGPGSGGHSQGTAQGPSRR